MNFISDAELARLLNDDRQKREADLRTARDIDLFVGRCALALLAWFLITLFSGGFE